jgi:hypothetical protein
MAQTAKITPIRPKPPKPPVHLSRKMKVWWQSVVKDYVLEDHHILLLTKAAEAYDRADKAREVLDSQGLTYTDRFGQPCARPECGIERDSRLAFARLLRELNLSESLDDSRPPPLRYAGG